MVSNLGDEMAFFGLGVMVVYSWKGTALDLSIVMASSALPVLLFGPFAGVFVDRWNKKFTMISADIIGAFLALLFIFCTQVWHIAIVVFLLSTVSRFFYPARVAIIPEILERDILVEANSLSQLTYMLSVILGPAIATSMIYLLGYFWIFIFDSLSYLFSAVMIAWMRYRPRERGGEKKKPLREMLDGFRYMRRNPTVKLLIAIFATVMLFVGGLNVIFAIYIRDVVQMDIAGYGAMEILFGIGTVAGSVSTGILAGRISEGRMILGGILGIGTIILILGIIPIPAVALVLGGFLIGYFVGFLNAPSTALLQKAVPEEYRGRVFGAQGAIIQGAMLISIVLIGTLTSIVGVIPVIIASGMFIVSLAALLLSVPRFSRALSSSGE